MSPWGGGVFDQILGHAAHADDRPRAFTVTSKMTYEIARPLDTLLVVREGRIGESAARDRWTHTAYGHTYDHDNDDVAR